MDRAEKPLFMRVLEFCEGNKLFYKEIENGFCNEQEKKVSSGTS